MTIGANNAQLPKNIKYGGLLYPQTANSSKSNSVPPDIIDHSAVMGIGTWELGGLGACRVTVRAEL